MGTKETLSFGGPVNFSKEGGVLSGFEIDAYTGATIDRFWGKLIVSIAGISAKQSMPIFKDHDRAEIVGYSTSSSKGSSFRVKGLFSKSTKAAQQVMALAAEGFPWQASIGVKPLRILELKEGASMLVNNQNITGPVSVWMESEVLETSFVPLGADGNTSAAVFSENGSKETGTVEETAKATWEKSEDVRDEFRTFGAYLAFMKADEAGRVRIFGQSGTKLIHNSADGNMTKSDSNEAAWQNEFERNENLKDEFRTMGIYLAYRKAESEGRVKIFGHKSQLNMEGR